MGTKRIIKKADRYLDSKTFTTKTYTSGSVSGETFYYDFDEEVTLTNISFSPSISVSSGSYYGTVSVSVEYVNVYSEYFSNIKYGVSISIDGPVTGKHISLHLPHPYSSTTVTCNPNSLSATEVYEDTTVTASSPSGTSIDMKNDVNFSWTVNGPYTKSELEYSTDGGSTWDSLAEVSGTGTSTKVPGSTFPAGQISWHVRAFSNKANSWSEWSAQKNFTITTSSASISLSEPTGSATGSSAIPFRWSITPGSGSITSTILEYSTDSGESWSTLDSWSSAVTSYTAPAGKFPAGRIDWRVRACDSVTGWVDKSAYFTVRYTGASVKLTTPTSGNVDGSTKITFAWEITPGGGTITLTQMEYSADDGLTWEQLVDYAGSQTRYEVAAGTFNAGQVKWRVRVNDSYAGLSAWATATVTVKYTNATINLTTPTGNKEFDGANEIQFAWTITKGSGDIKETHMEYSTDSGATWTSLVDEEKTVQSYKAAKVSFPSGEIKWRVRVISDYTGEASADATFRVKYSAVSQVVPVDTCPTSGNISTQSEIYFQVRLTASAPVYTPFTIKNAIFYWRSGDSGDFAARPMARFESNAVVKIVAGTFPDGIIQWYARATDNTDRTTETEIYTLEAFSADVVAVPSAPIDTVESVSSDIEFRWVYRHLNDTPQDSVQIQLSEDEETWTTLPTITGADVRSYKAEPSSIPAGTVYWRVRAKTAEEEYGPWSVTVSFICYGASSVSSVRATSNPWTTVSWQTTGQLSYEVKIDEIVYGPFFGAEVREYESEIPLEDGMHTAQVRVQNRYGIWSEWKSAQFYTRNASTPTTARIELEAAADKDVSLQWFVFGDDAGTPNIIDQPRDMSTTDGVISFCINTDKKRCSFWWFMRASEDDEWQMIDGGGSAELCSDAISLPAEETLDGYEFICRVDHGIYSEFSDTAVYTYAEPADKPAIVFQPEDVQKKTGIATFCFGSDASEYRWYRRLADADADIFAVSGDGKWRMLYGYSYDEQDLPVTDGETTWHISHTESDEGAVVIESDGGDLWYMPYSLSTDEWVDTGVAAPMLRFQASEAMDGAEFYCHASNAEGTVDSAVVKFIYADEPGESVPGDYYVYKDGELIARQVFPTFVDRLAIGEHSYHVINKISRGMYQKSNSVTVNVSIDSVAIAPLEGGDWIDLRMTDKSGKETSLEYGHKVSYVHYSGAAYPEAEISEEKELTGSFETYWLYPEKEKAKAFEALIGSPVVLKTTNDVVIVGILDAVEVHGPGLYLVYAFTLRQIDWGYLDRA